MGYEVQQAYLQNEVLYILLPKNISFIDFSYPVDQTS